MIYDNDGNEVRCSVSYVFAAANGKTYTSFFSLAVFPEDTRASNAEIRRTFA